MRNSKILLIAGLGLLLISLLGQGKPGKEEIGDIEPSAIGERIQVFGHVTSFSNYNSTIFMNVSDKQGSIPVVSFNSVKMFSEGEDVVVTGEVTMYQGELEIVADRISRTDPS